MAARQLNPALATAVLLVPWLWPFAPGPTSAALPWLVSAACAAIFVLIVTWRPTAIAGAATQSWLIAALVSSVIGLLQYLGASSALQPFVDVTPLGQAFGNLRQRNQFATLTNIGLLVLLWGLSATRRAWHDAFDPGERRSSHAPAAFLVAASVLSFANVASSSRTGLVELLMLALLALVWGGRSSRARMQVLAAAMLAYAVASYLLPLLAGLEPFSNGIASRFSNAGQACGSRLVLWGNVLHLIAQKPWFGWGWGELDYAHFVTLYPGARFCEILDNAHNLPLHLAVELGLPFALAACSVGAAVVWRARPWREANPARQMAWGVLALIALHSLLEYPLWYGPFQVAVGLCVWILWREPRASQPAPAPRLRRLDGGATVLASRPALRWAISASAIALLLALAYAAWDYRRVGQIYRAPDRRTAAYRDDTLRKIQGSWLFRDQVRFAALTLTRPDAGNAATVNAMAHDLLHFSPEPRVIERLIESAELLGRSDEADFFRARYRAAFALDYARWAGERPTNARSPSR